MSSGESKPRLPFSIAGRSEDAGQDPLSIEKIISQIPDRLRGEVSMHMRPGDVRIALLTADLGGQVHEFPNIGSPDNRPSSVPFDGKSCIQIMLKGDTPRQQLMSAQAVIDEMCTRGLARVNPDFIDTYMTARGAEHPFIRQNYGPAPYDEAVGLFVDTTILDQNSGQLVTVNKETGEGFTFGFREPAQEEAFLIICAQSPQDVFVRGGRSAAAVLQSFEDTFKLYAGAERTALEALQGFGCLAKGIVFSSRDGDDWKPIDLNVAPEIFDLGELSVLFIKPDGTVIGAYQSVPLDATNSALGQAEKLDR